MMRHFFLEFGNSSCSVGGEGDRLVLSGGERMVRLGLRLDSDREARLVRRGGRRLGVCGHFGCVYAIY